MKTFIVLFVFFFIFSFPAQAKQDQEGTASGQNIEVSGITIVPVKTAKNPSPRSQNALDHISIVAKTVQELLSSPDRQGGIGQQVRLVARAQNQAQQQTEQELTDLKSRPGFLKKLIGPNYKTIKKIERIQAQNQSRIQQMQNLLTQADDSKKQESLAQAIAAVNQQNSLLQAAVEQENNIKSLLGWAFKFFSK